MTRMPTGRVRGGSPGPKPHARPKATLKTKSSALQRPGTLALEVGCMLLAIALFFECATFAPSAAFDAWVPLFVALVLTVLANAFLAGAWRYGGAGVRVLAALTLLPTLYIVSDLIRRAPLFFR